MKSALQMKSLRDETLSRCDPLRGGSHAPKGTYCSILSLLKNEPKVKSIFLFPFQKELFLQIAGKSQIQFPFFLVNAPSRAPCARSLFFFEFLFFLFSFCVPTCHPSRAKTAQKSVTASHPRAMWCNDVAPGGAMMYACGAMMDA